MARQGCQFAYVVYLQVYRSWDRRRQRFDQYCGAIAVLALRAACSKLPEDNTGKRRAANSRSAPVLMKGGERRRAAGPIRPARARLSPPARSAGVQASDPEQAKASRPLLQRSGSRGARQSGRRRPRSPWPLPFRNQKRGLRRSSAASPSGPPHASICGRN
jgi:hypothetical protein